MDTFPSLKIQILWILLLSGLSYLAIKAIKAKKMIDFSSDKGPSVGLKDIILTFGFYLLLTVSVVPIVFGLLGTSTFAHPLKPSLYFSYFS